MVRMARSCLQTLLKLVNSGMTMIGIAIILYALWMFRGWQKHLAPHVDVPLPWFIYTFLGIGITMCIISCSGHIAAETANGCCLYIYMVFLLLLVMIEAAVTTDVFLNHSWEEDFPVDRTGNLDQLKHFIKDNFDVCKWIGLSVVGVQGLSLLFAMTLKALGPHPERYYESDDDYLPDRVPLLRPYVPPPNYAVGDPVYGSRNNSWNIRVNSKGIDFHIYAAVLADKRISWVGYGCLVSLGELNVVFLTISLSTFRVESACGLPPYGIPMLYICPYTVYNLFFVLQLDFKTRMKNLSSKNQFSLLFKRVNVVACFYLMFSFVVLDFIVFLFVIFLVGQLAQYQ